MLKNYPVKINEVALFPADSWEESCGIIENVYETEAGTDQVSVTRYDKLSIRAQYRCSSAWLARFKEWAQTDSLTVKFYDAMKNGYATRVMRMRDLKYKLVERTERLFVTNGAWDVSFSLEEF